MDGFMRIALSSPFDYDDARRYVGTEARYPAMYISVIYVIVIFAMKSAMANFKPFQLTVVLSLWNTWLALFSVIGSAITSFALFTDIKNNGLTGSYTQVGDFFHGTSGYFAWLFCMSKVAELGDTILIVLRKKPLIFLHWYHHVLTLNYGMLSYAEKTPYNAWIIWLNFTVHAVMYSYYFLRSIHVRVPAAIARSITLLQITQFLITLVILVHIGVLRLLGVKMEGALFTYFFCLGMEISYVALFANFFYQSYVKKGGRKFNAEKEAMSKNE